MEPEEWILILGFFGLLAFFAFLVSRRTAAPNAGTPYLMIEKDEQGRIINIQPVF